MKIKFILFTLISFLFINVVYAKNVPEFDNTTQYSYSGNGYTMPVTKFDLYNKDLLDETNYANDPIMNLNLNEEKSFSLDFFTMFYYYRYPNQNLTINISDNTLLDLNLFLDDVKQDTLSVDLPQRIDNSGYYNNTYPKISFNLLSKGIEGLVKIDFVVTSTYESYPSLNNTETLSIYVNISDNVIPNISDAIYFEIYSGIHSGYYQNKYSSSENIGIFTEAVGSVGVNIPEEVTLYNETANLKINHRFITDKTVSVNNDLINFIDTTSRVFRLVLEYYITYNGIDIVIEANTYTLVLYNRSDFRIIYPSDRLYSINTPIKVEALNPVIKPYLEDIIVAFEGTPTNDTLKFLEYIDGAVYVVKDNTSEIKIGDKFLVSVNIMNGNSTTELFFHEKLTPDNVYNVSTATSIELYSEYYAYDVNNSLNELIEIKNISEFSYTCNIQVKSNGVITPSITTDRKILLSFESSSNITQTINEKITIFITLEDNTILTKEFEVSLVPEKGYIYTFDKLTVNLQIGKTQTVTLGYFDPYFISADGSLVEKYYLKNGNVVISPNVLNPSSFDLTGYKKGYDTAYFVIGEQVIEINVVINDELIQESTQFTFNEGSIMTILVNDNLSTISVPEELESYLFTFVILDEKIAVMSNIRSNKVSIKGFSEGETQVFAYTNIGDVTYSAVITIKVIERLPNLNINIEKELDLTSYTIFDRCYVTFDAENFDFSNDTKYLWYVNDELVKEDAYEFFIYFVEGINTIKLEIIDNINNIKLSQSQEINVSSVKNAERILKINTDEVIYVDLHGDDFEIEVLLDGVINKNYKYIWNISNTNICSIKINGNEKIILKPNLLGDVILTCMTNISKFDEVYIKSEIKISIIEPTYKLKMNSFVKPDIDHKITVLGNDLPIYNTEIKPVILNNDVNYTDFEVINNEIILNKIKKGSYNISLNLNGEDISSNFDVTNFNIKEIARQILPYLISLCLIVILIAFIVKKRKTKLQRAIKKINKLDKLSNELMNKEVTIKDVKKLLKIAKKVKRMFNYCIDNGIDELSNLLPNIDKLINILIATIKVNKIDKLKLIIKNIKNNNIDKLIKDFLIIKDEREEFDNKKKVADEVVDKHGKKVKVTKEQYESYLAESKYAEDDN